MHVSYSYNPKTEYKSLPIRNYQDNSLLKQVEELHVTTQRFYDTAALTQGYIEGNAANSAGYKLQSHY